MVQKKNKKKKSFVGIILFVLFAFLMASGVFLYLNFGDIAKNVTEKIASDALGVKVHISSLDVSLTDKKVVVRDLRIANPPGYENANAMSVNAITIGLKSVSRELIDFKQIKVEGVLVNLEVTDKGSNLSALKKRAETRSKRKAPQKSEEQVRVIIRKMIITSSALNPSISLLGGSLGTVKVPAISLSGIGVKENGVVAKDAITQIVTQYITTAENKAGSLGLLGDLNDIKNQVGDVGEGIKKIGTGLTDGLTEGLGKSLGGIFGK